MTAQWMNGTCHQRAIKAHAMLGTVENGVEHHVPARRDQRNHQRQQADVPERIAQQPCAQRRANKKMLPQIKKACKPLICRLSFQAQSNA